MGEEGLGVTGRERHQPHNFTTSQRVCGTLLGGGVRLLPVW